MLLVLLLSYVQLFVTPWTVAHQAPSVHGDSPGKNTEVGCHFFLTNVAYHFIIEAPA